MEHLQFPIGSFLSNPELSAEELNQLIQLMQSLPARYSEQVANLPEKDLVKTYREGSWTVRQLVHHVADIHLHNFLRVKNSQTEESYTVVPTKVDAWAATPDAALAPVAGSLSMLEGITQRFIFLIRNLDEEQLQKSFFHPGRQIYFSMPQAVNVTVWHLEHHLAHIRLALGL